jgi:aminomethyltransferase
MGVAEMTRFGMDEADFEELAGLFASALRDEPGIAGEVAEFRGRFVDLRYCFDLDGFGDAGDRLLRTV